MVCTFFSFESMKRYRLIHPSQHTIRGPCGTHVGIAGLPGPQIAHMGPMEGLYGSCRAFWGPDSSDGAHRGPIWELRALIVPDSPDEARRGPIWELSGSHRPR